MKISTSFSKTIPGEEEYSGLGNHLQLEVEPPPEIPEDREMLRRYVQSLFTECRERVGEEFGQQPLSAHLVSLAPMAQALELGLCGHPILARVLRDLPTAPSTPPAPARVIAGARCSVPAAT